MNRYDFAEIAIDLNERQEAHWRTGIENGLLSASLARLLEHVDEASVRGRYDDLLAVCVAGVDHFEMEVNCGDPDQMQKMMSLLMGVGPYHNLALFRGCVSIARELADRDVRFGLAVLSTQLLAWNPWSDGVEVWNAVHGISNEAWQSECESEGICEYREAMFRGV